MSTHATRFQDLPYRSLPLPQTHPDVLATCAALRGLHPADITQARVLELGCASGGNLIPLAATLPAARFVGIDLSQGAIAAGQSLCAELGLRNIELLAADIAALPADLGAFDYILCHGVYSWVPQPVRAHILRIYQQHLAPQGIGYISYNTYPGFYKRQAAREMMRYHVRGVADAHQAARQARGLLEFLLHGVPDSEGVYAHLLRQEAERLRGSPDSYLVQEHLMEDNQPFYFHEFMAAAQAHGLRYLAEAEGQTSPDEFPPQVARALHALGDDVVTQEQYLDFLRDRSLRQTLLCHAAARPSKAPQAERLAGLFASAFARPVREDATAAGAAEVSFASKNGVVSTGDPAVKAVLLALHQARPRALSLPALGAAVAELLGEAPAADLLAAVLLEAHGSSLVQLHVHPPRFASSVSARPVASPLARRLAEVQPLVTNLCHEPVELGAVERVLLPHLDGTQDAAALCDRLVAAARAGVLKIQRGGEQVTDETMLRQALGGQVAPALSRIAAAALLIDDSPTPRFA